MKFLRDRPYFLSILASVLVAVFGGMIALASLLFYVLGVNFAGPIYAAMIQANTARVGVALSLGLFLLLFGLIGRAVFHMARVQRRRQSGV